MHNSNGRKKWGVVLTTWRKREITPELGRLRQRAAVKGKVRVRREDEKEKPFAKESNRYANP